MRLSRRKFLKSGAASAAGLALGRQARPSLLSNLVPAAGPFEPSWESLQKYQCPEWFRDAKFGIWAHWTAQCVPEQGDWYARQMYQQGSPDYNYQVAHYGHPSKFGFKDIDHLWHAENWDPEKLIPLYRSAGANYFVALAHHHDNFDCFDSQYQPWNSVKIGPKKDIVGMWARIARREGMRFGVSSHATHAWSWFEVAQGADQDGPLAGVPYDGRMTRADGKGQWWEGLDPQDLYTQNHSPGKGGFQWDWNTAKGSSIPDQAYCRKYYNRVVDLIEKYHPDLLYFDDQVLPFYGMNDIGLRLAAHYYNSNILRHGGKLEAVINASGLDAQQRRCLVRSYERGRSETVEPSPWQTETCIGEWHYRRSIYDNHQYKTPERVLHMLIDIVSKNGNLLLNIPLRGDGSIDPDEVSFLQAMTVWMRINREALHTTRPWTIAAEGPVSAGNGDGGERFTAADFRFTTKGNTLYAIALGWPENGILTLRTLATQAAGIVGDVKRVQLLGDDQSLPFTRTVNGLTVTLPREKPCDHAWALKISGLDVAASHPILP